MLKTTGIKWAGKRPNQNDVALRRVCLDDLIFSFFFFHFWLKNDGGRSIKVHNARALCYVDVCCVRMRLVGFRFGSHDLPGVLLTAVRSGTDGLISGLILQVEIKRFDFYVVYFGICGTGF